MKTGLKKVLTRVTAAAVTCATLLATPVFTTTGYASIDRLDSYITKVEINEIHKSHHFYSQDYYNAASRQMITTVLTPMKLYIEKKEDEYGYHYDSDDKLLKDAALIYMMMAVAHEHYTTKNNDYFVCSNFAGTLNVRVNYGWVGSTHITKIKGCGTGDHEANEITIDGNKYELEPQNGLIYTGITTEPNYNPKYGTPGSRSMVELVDRLAHPVPSDRVDFINSVTHNLFFNRYDYSQLYRLNPLLVLQAQHPEFFTNKAITREMITDNLEIYYWQAAWYSIKYRNHDRSLNSRFKKLIF